MARNSVPPPRRSLPGTARAAWTPTIWRALRAAGGLVPDAAAALGISPTELLRLLRVELAEMRERRRLLEERAARFEQERSSRPSVASLRTIADRRGERLAWRSSTLPPPPRRSSMPPRSSRTSRTSWTQSARASKPSRNPS